MFHPVPEGAAPLRTFAAVILFASLASCTVAPTKRDEAPPPAPREFRAAWVASVANIDWPSKPGLTSAQQREEIVRIVERARSLNLNALIVQVRPAADALYASALEPWSEYLTGTQGQAPEPFYDPLAVWIAEAHRRGIELHAWFNPYRARHSTGRSPLAPGHVANVAPSVVKSYGDFLWLDPGEMEASRRTLAAILDVVRRYDVDGVHIDDYFYPYPIAAPDGRDLDFPDEPSWQEYLRVDGTLTRDAWRRRNVNALVWRIHAEVHREKAWVRFGVSPFGVGRPDRRPPGVTGFSQYDKLNADVELWLAQGWLDYLAPQLYWAIDSPGQPFGVLLDYWTGANTAGRHVWPGLFTSRINNTPQTWTAAEIANQVSVMRERRAGGHIHFSMIALLENRQGIADLLSAAYRSPALVPATPWLADAIPASPEARTRIAGSDPGGLWIDVAGKPGPGSLLAIWARYGESWVFSVSPAGGPARVAANLADRPIDALVISAVNRIGLESPRVSVALPPPVSR